MDSNFSVKITADISELQARLKSVEQAMGGLRNATNTATTSLKDMESNANRGRLVAFAFGQVLRDAGFFAQDFKLGLLAISNNIPILIDQLVLLSGVSSTLGGIISLLGSALTAGLTIWAYTADSVNKTSDAYKKAMYDAESSAQGQIASFNALLSVARDTTLSYNTRQQAVQKLNAEHKELNDTLTVENVNTDQARKLTDNLSQSMLLQAKASAIATLAGKAFADNLKAQQTGLVEQAGTFTQIYATILNSLGLYTKSAEVLGETGFKNQQDSIKRTKQEYESYSKMLSDIMKQMGNMNTLFVDNSKKETKARRDSIDATKLYARQVGSVPMGLQTPILGPDVKKINIVGKFKSEFSELQRFIIDMIPTIGDLTQSLVSTLGNGFADIITTFADGLGQLISGDMSLADFGRSIIASIGKFLSQMGKQMIAFGAATIAYGVALKAIKSGNPAAMIAGGGTLIAAGAALAVIGAAISGLASGRKGGAGGESSVDVAGSFGSVRPFAAGGIVSGPTLGLMGEYPGARRNPEVVAPLDKLKSIIGSSSAPADSGTLVTRISGNDLVILMDRAKKNRQNYF